MAPAQIEKWVRTAYPKPRVKQVWLDECCEWIEDDQGLDAARDTANFIEHVDLQLLASDLVDSTEPGTGFPRRAAEMNNERINGAPILAEILALTEIGSSAFNIYNVRQARVERADLAGLAQAEGEEDDTGPIPKYPRQMLRLEVTDGSMILPAIEYRSIPAFDLAETFLGSKILIKDVLVRRGILFLEPNGIEFLGHKVEDRDAHRERDFVKTLFRRMMKPVPDDSEEEEMTAGGEEFREPPLPPAQAPSGRTRALPAAPSPDRRPHRNLPDPFDVDELVIDADAESSRSRRLPAVHTRSVSRSIPTSSQNTLVNSRYFSVDRESSAATAVDSPIMGQLSRMLSPARGEPYDIIDFSFEEGQRQNTSSSKGKQKAVADDLDDFDMDNGDDLDEETLAALDKAEREALQGSPTKQCPNTIITDTRSSSPKKTAMPSSFAAPSTNPKPQVSQDSASTLAQRMLSCSHGSGNSIREVITVDDDDGDDKENVPMPTTRRVRRRLSPSHIPHDVIDISD